MNYIDEIATALHEACPSIDLETDPTMARAYTLLVLTTGEATTSEHVHDAWAVVRLATRPLCRSRSRRKRSQAYDDKFRDAIRVVAGGRIRAAAQS